MILMVAVCSFLGCKKSEEKAATEGKQQANNRQAQKQKRARRGKAPRVHTLQIYQDEKLVADIPRAQYETLTTTAIQVKGKEEKAILLSDLLKKHNLTGKNVVLRGPSRASSITWEQATTNQIYLYPFKNRMMVFHQSKDLEDSRIPTAVVRIDVGDKAVATNDRKGGKKKAT